MSRSDGFDIAEDDGVIDFKMHAFWGGNFYMGKFFDIAVPLVGITTPLALANHDAIFFGSAIIFMDGNFVINGQITARPRDFGSVSIIDSDFPSIACDDFNSTYEIFYF